MDSKLINLSSSKDFIVLKYQNYKLKLLQSLKQKYNFLQS